jgi:hypothetical protein
MLFIVIILYYLKDTNRKHYKLFEEYGETKGGMRAYSKQQLKIDPTPLFYPSEAASVTLRPCEIRFNKNGSSKYIFKDDWKEIATINNNTGENSENLPFANKILTKEGANKSNFNNFSEESRCFKLKNKNNDLNKYKYKGNSLISYNNNKYTTLQTADGGKKEYMQMNFDPTLAEEKDYHKYAIESACSYTYDIKLTPPLKNAALYRLFIDEDKIIQSIDKIAINERNNNRFENIPLSLIELLDTSSTIYYYDTNSNAFNFKINKNDKMQGITIYKFERNLLCNKEEIVSYDKLIKDDTKLNTAALINIDELIKPIVINKTEITSDMLDNFRTLERYYNYNNQLVYYYAPKHFTNKEKILEIIKIYVDNRIVSLNDPVRKEIAVKNAELKELENKKNAFADTISTIDKYIINIITMDAQNYDPETKNFLNKYLKPGKISYQKYVEKKILAPRIIYDANSVESGDNYTKTINYAFGGNNGQILDMPHFPSFFRTNNLSTTITNTGWTIESSLKPLDKQGLSSILQKSDRRTSTQNISETKSVPKYNTTYSCIKEDRTPKCKLISTPYRFRNRTYYSWVEECNFKFGSITSCTKYSTTPNYVFRGYENETTEVPYPSAYGAAGINPIITITIPTINFISGFQFYGINGLYNTSHNAKNIEVYGKYQDTKQNWITIKVLTFILQNSASWYYSPFYKLDIPGDYKQLVFKVLDNWGDRSSTKIGSITLYNYPITTDIKTINLPTDIPVKINKVKHTLIAGDYNMKADIRKKIYSITDKKTNRQIATIDNTNSLALSYDVPKDIYSLLQNNKKNVSFSKIANEIQVKDNNTNLILLTSHKNIDTYETYNIKAYAYNNLGYKPNIKLYDSSNQEINSGKYKVLIDDADYLKTKNIFIVLNIFLILDISITGVVYLKTTNNNNDLFEYNLRNATDITNAVNNARVDTGKARELPDLRVIFDITDKQNEIDTLKLSLIKQSAVDKNRKGKTILSIRRDIGEYDDDITINKLKTTYFNLVNIDNLSKDNNSKVYNNKINISEAIKIGSEDNIEYNKYISYQNVDKDFRTPSIEKVKSDEIYDVKDYAKKYIYFTVKPK